MRTSAFAEKFLVNKLKKKSPPLFSLSSSLLVSSRHQSSSGPSFPPPPPPPPESKTTSSSSATSGVSTSRFTRSTASQSATASSTTGKRTTLPMSDMLTSQRPINTVKELTAFLLELRQHYLNDPTNTARLHCLSLFHNRVHDLRYVAGLEARCVGLLLQTLTLLEGTLTQLLPVAFNEDEPVRRERWVNLRCSEEDRKLQDAVTWMTLFLPEAPLSMVVGSLQYLLALTLCQVYTYGAPPVPAGTNPSSSSSSRSNSNNSPAIQPYYLHHQVQEVIRCFDEHTMIKVAGSLAPHWILTFLTCYLTYFTDQPTFPIERSDILLDVCRQYMSQLDLHASFFVKGTNALAMPDDKEELLAALSFLSQLQLAIHNDQFRSFLVQHKMLLTYYSLEEKALLVLLKVVSKTAATPAQGEVRSALSLQELLYTARLLNEGACLTAHTEEAAKPVNTLRRKLEQLVGRRIEEHLQSLVTRDDATERSYLSSNTLRLLSQLSPLCPAAEGVERPLAVSKEHVETLLSQLFSNVAAPNFDHDNHNQNSLAEVAVSVVQTIVSHHVTQRQARDLPVLDKDCALLGGARRDAETSAYLATEEPFKLYVPQVVLSYGASLMDAYVEAEASAPLDGKTGPSIFFQLLKTYCLDATYNETTQRFSSAYYSRAVLPDIRRSGRNEPLPAMYILPLCNRHLLHALSTFEEPQQKMVMDYLVDNVKCWNVHDVFLFLNALTLCIEPDNEPRNAVAREILRKIAVPLRHSVAHASVRQLVSVVLLYARSHVRDDLLCDAVSQRLRGMVQSTELLRMLKEAPQRTTGKKTPAGAPTPDPRSQPKSRDAQANDRGERLELESVAHILGGLASLEYKSTAPFADSASFILLKLALIEEQATSIQSDEKKVATPGAKEVVIYGDPQVYVRLVTSFATQMVWNFKVIHGLVDVLYLLSRPPDVQFAVRGGELYLLDYVRVQLACAQMSVVHKKFSGAFVRKCVTLMENNALARLKVADTVLLLSVLSRLDAKALDFSAGDPSSAATEEMKQCEAVLHFLMSRLVEKREELDLQLLVEVLGALAAWGQMYPTRSHDQQYTLPVAISTACEDAGEQQLQQAHEGSAEARALAPTFITAYADQFALRALALAPTGEWQSVAKLANAYAFLHRQDKELFAIIADRVVAEKERISAVSLALILAAFSNLHIENDRVFIESISVVRFVADYGNVGDVVRVAKAYADVTLWHYALFARLADRAIQLRGEFGPSSLVHLWLAYTKTGMRYDKVFLDMVPRVVTLEELFSPLEWSLLAHCFCNAMTQKGVMHLRKLTGAQANHPNDSKNDKFNSKWAAVRTFLDVCGKRCLALADSFTEADARRLLEALVSIEVGNKELAEKLKARLPALAALCEQLASAEAEEPVDASSVYAKLDPSEQK